MKPSLLPQYRRRSRGFALIIALSLVSFIFLLIVSLSMYVQVEQQTAASKQYELEARQAAMLSLRVALGELQSELGPDQRISARAELYDSDPNTAVAEDVDQPYWVGVWDGETRHSDHETSGLLTAFTPNPDDYFANWLVSGNDATTAPDPLVAGDPQSTVTLVTETSSGAGDAVSVPLVDVVSGETSYAWWVGDLGMQARINTEVPSDPNWVAPSVEHLSPLSGFHIHDEFSAARATPESFQTQLGRLQTPEQLELFSWVTDPTDGSPIAGKYQHDLTVYSNGVLADVRRGGLKRDLTAGLQPSETEPSGQMFEPLNGPSANPMRDPGGPEWEQLRSFYNFRPQSGAITPQGFTDTQVGIHPVVTYWNLGYTFSLVRPGGTLPASFADIGTSVTLRAHIHPMVVLWNPYNYPIAAHTYHMYMAARELSLGARVVFSDRGIWNTTQYAAAVKYSSEEKPSGFHPMSVALPDDNDVGLSEIFRIRSSQMVWGDNGSFKFALECPELAPGEGVVLSASGYDPLQTPTHGDYLANNSSDWNVLTEGFRRENYFYQDISGDMIAAEYAALPDVNDNIVDINILPINPYGQAGFSNFVIMAGSPAEMTTEPMVFQKRVRTPLDTEDDFETNAGFASFNEYWTIPRWRNGFNGWLNIIDPSYEGILTYDNVTASEEAYPTFGFHAQLVAGNPETVHNDARESTYFRWLANHNPRASIMGRTPADSTTRRMGIPLLNSHSYFRTVEKSYLSLDDFAFVGNGTFDPSVTETVLFDVASDESELTSLGYFMHASLYKAGIDGVNSFGSVTMDSSGDDNYFGNSVLPAYAIGNSLADPRVPPGQAYATLADWHNDVNNDHVHYDYSYLLNEAIWDQHFLSTVPYETGTDPNQPYNPRMQPIEGVDLEAMRDGGLLYEQAAANLMNEGAFNVNSTSVTAWETLLASYLGVAPDGAVADQDQALFARFDTGTATTPNVIDTSSLVEGSSESYTGQRTISDNEIRQLAENIVELVKERGPFFSMSQFINRTLTTDTTDDARLTGLLQAAIDEGSADLNANIAQSTDAILYRNPVESFYGTDFYEVDHMIGRRNEGVATYLTQADLLARIGPSLTARSDTFVIRAYGESKDPENSNVRASVIYEAVVQRTPEYVEADADTAWTDPDSLVSQTNLNFGRRFKIVSIRELDEI